MSKAMISRWEDIKQKENKPALKNLDEFNKNLSEFGNDNELEFYQCMNCKGVFIDTKPKQCACGNNEIIKVLVKAKKETPVEVDGDMKKIKTGRQEPDGWLEYQVQDAPHFKDVKSWLEAVKEIGNENNNQFYFCEKCEGIFVNHSPMTCSCGQNLEECFKEIDGQMRKQLIEERTLKELNKYSYIQ